MTSGSKEILDRGVRMIRHLQRETFLAFNFLAAMRHFAPVRQEVDAAIGVGQAIIVSALYQAAQQHVARLWDTHGDAQSVEGLRSWVRNDGHKLFPHSPGQITIKQPWGESIGGTQLTYEVYTSEGVRERLEQERPLLRLVRKQIDKLVWWRNNVLAHATGREFDLEKRGGPTESELLECVVVAHEVVDWYAGAVGGLTYPEPAACESDLADDTSTVGHAVFLLLYGYNEWCAQPSPSINKNAVARLSAMRILDGL